MAQFLLITTLLTIAGLLASMIVGFLSTPMHASQHVMFALATVVIGLFSQSMTMFFFIGTGKQLKDGVKGTSDEEPVRRSIRALKSRVFPIATYATAVLMVTFIMGGGVRSGKTPRWLHDVLAFASLVMFMRAYWMQINAMNDNAEMMEKYLKDGETRIKD